MKKSVELDKSQEWRDNRGRIWRWSETDGWVVNDRAAWGGFWPDESHWPFELACRHDRVEILDNSRQIVMCTNCGADLSPRLA